MSSRAVKIEFPRDNPIVNEGELAKFLFYITRGTVRLYRQTRDGRRQIMGFPGKGNLIGLPFKDRYACCAEAVTSVRAYRIPREELETEMGRFPHTQQRMLGVVLSELVQAQDHLVLLGRKTAMEKLVTFLLLQFRRHATGSGGITSLVALPMCRSDIADYLGLTTETVSRTFSLLKGDRLIRIHSGGLVELADCNVLESIADGK
jgi:CRP/FNR family transcriptional regulator